MDSASSSTPSVSAQVQPSTARLGDLISMDIRVAHPPGLAVEPPSFQKNLGAFEVYASTAGPVEAAGPVQTQHFLVELQSFTTGQLALPGLELSYHDAMGAAHVLKTPELRVTIEAVTPGPKDKGDIRGIKGVLGPVAWSPWWWMVAGLLAAGAGAWFWAHRRKKIQGPPPPPPIPADQQALDRLKALTASGDPDPGQIKEFYIALSDIVRAYLENGFHCPALERTTGEILRDLRDRPVFDSARRVLLKNLLEDCDLVKFAKFRPDVSDALKDHAQAVQIVEQTRHALRT